MVQLNWGSYNQPDFNEKPTDKKQLIKMSFFAFSVMMVIVVFVALGKKTNSVEVNNNSLWQKVTGVFSFNVQPEEIDTNYIMPKEEPDRLDILILGIRGENDPDAKDGGPLLTDTMMLLSFDKTTKKASLVSIPRDLYVKITPKSKNKLNSAYEYGYYHTNSGLNYTKELVSKISGVYIDKAVIINFSSFEKLIDDIGGIDVTLAQPFSEAKQWGYSFELPAGPNHLDGKNALYYARSRYSSNDFDRSRRQQEVMFAVKTKLTKLNFWADPIKTVNILNSLRSEVKTDINIWNLKDVLDLAKELNSTEKIKRYVISTDNLLYDTKTPEGSYILLPQGDNFDQIKKFFQEVIQ